MQDCSVAPGLKKKWMDNLGATVSCISKSCSLWCTNPHKRERETFEFPKI